MMEKSRRASSAVSEEVGSSNATSRPPPFKRPHDLDELALGRPEAAAGPARRQLAGDAERLEQGPRPPLEIAPIEKKPGPGVDVAEKDILGDRQLGDDLGLLVDHADAGRVRLRRAAEAHGRPVDEDAAAVRLEDAFEQPHQRRLAGAVLADQRQDLAGPDLEADALERLDDAEALGHALDGHQGCCLTHREKLRRPQAQWLQSFALYWSKVAAVMKTGSV